jgi:hypothetical protein
MCWVTPAGAKNFFRIKIYAEKTPYGTGLGSNRPPCIYLIFDRKYAEMEAEE